MQRRGRVRRFVLVGDGPLRASLQVANADLLLCGVRTGAPLADHYASADVFLFPSETETFGNVILEAMASALSVVAYDYAAAWTHIRDGETGVLVPYGDARAFLGPAAAVAGSPESLRTIRRRAREAATGFDWRVVVGRFEALLTNAGRQGSERSDAEGGVVCW